MQQVAYGGALWDGDAIHPDLWRLLMGRNLLIECTAGAPPYRVVLGVPHHAAPGVPYIADQWAHPRTGARGRRADETAGLPALALFSELQKLGVSSKLVIAAHAADHDPNKTPGSPYWESIFQDPLPRLIFEMHGAGPGHQFPLELSAGSNRAANPEEFGRVLMYFLGNGDQLARQVEPGQSEGAVHDNGRPRKVKLEMPALRTKSLTYAGELGIPSLHLEMKFDYRRCDPDFPAAPRPSAAGRRLAGALAQSMALMTASNDITISAEAPGSPSTAFLTRPSMEYEDSYLEAMRETPLQEINNNPELRVQRREEFAVLVQTSRGVSFDGMPEHPPEEYLWLIDRGEFIARAFFLHWLNDFRRKTDGQIDYWVRPSRRRQGYGRLLLRLLLERYRQLGAKRVFISCLARNTASRRIIEANGGVFDSEILSPEADGTQPRRRYWIELSQKSG
jgi:predicted acetyltransferase